MKKDVYRKMLLFSSCVKIENSLYFITSGENKLMNMDLETGIMSYVSAIDDISEFMINEGGNIDSIQYFDKKIYVIGIRSKKLFEYSLHGKKFKTYDLNCNVQNYGNIGATVCYDGKLYIFPKLKKEMIIFDMSNGKITTSCELYNFAVESFVSEKNEIPQSYFSSGFLKDDCFWLFMAEGYIAVKYNFRNGKSDIYILPPEINQCIQVCNEKDDFYVLGINKIFKWNVNSNMVQVICSYNQGDNTRALFGNMAMTNRNIWMLPSFGKDILIIDRATNKIKIYDRYPDDFHYYRDDWGKYPHAWQDENKYYYAAHNANYVLCIDKESGIEQWIKPILPSLKESYRYYRENNNNFFQEEIWGINNFITAIEKDDTGKRKKGFSINGKKILENTK